MYCVLYATLVLILGGTGNGCNFLGSLKSFELYSMRWLSARGHRGAALIVQQEAIGLAGIRHCRHVPCSVI